MILTLDLPFLATKACIAPDIASTWSSCAPYGKTSHSSTKLLFHPARIIKTFDDSDAAENTEARSCLEPDALCPRKL
jgi:hypothetical protein